MARVDAMARQKRVIGPAGRLGHKAGRDDVEGVLEQPLHSELLDGAQRMVARAIGEDQLATRQPGDFQRQTRIGRQAGTIDVMHEIEKMLGRNIVLINQTAQRRAMLVIVVTLQRARRGAVEAAVLDEIERDALLDLRPEPAIGGIERVVEIEHPGRHAGEMRRQRGIDGGFRGSVHEHACATTGPCRPVYDYRIVASMTITACGLVVR